MHGIFEGEGGGSAEELFTWSLLTQHHMIEENDIGMTFKTVKTKE